MNLHLFDISSSYTFVLSGSTTCNVHLFRQRVVTHESILDDTIPHAVFSSSHEMETPALLSTHSRKRMMCGSFTRASPGLRSPHSTELNHFPRLSMQALMNPPVFERKLCFRYIRVCIYK